MSVEGLPLDLVLLSWLHCAAFSPRLLDRLAYHSNGTGIGISIAWAGLCCKSWVVLVYHWLIVECCFFGALKRFAPHDFYDAWREDWEIDGMGEK